MKLNQKSLSNAEAWLKSGIELPGFDRGAVAAKTLENPQWIHFGAGNIFRGYVADLHQVLLNKNKAETGIIAAEAFDYEIIDKTYTPYDNLNMLVVMNADGSFEKRVIVGIVEGLAATPGRKSDWDRLTAVFEAQSLQMASFTITEKGYRVFSLQGDLLDAVKEDIQNGPEKSQTAMGIVCGLLYRRYLAGAYPVTMVSMDNCSHNGDKLREALVTIANGWVNSGLADKGFAGYLCDRAKVGFPLSMIDKITPNPSLTAAKLLTDSGVEDMEIFRTAKNSCVAPFVNAEKAQYLVIEDWFTNGRPSLEEAGVYFTDRETVDRVEKMKVCTCLNPLHTSLAVFGCLLGFTSISSEMKNEDLRKLVERESRDEAIKVVVDPGIIRPEDFLNVVLTERFPNPNVPDTPQRIACDTSQKVAIRFGETIKAYRDREDLDPAELTLIPLVLAAWCRYLLGKDDDWNDMELSPDPMLDELTAHLENIRLGKENDIHSALKPILSNEKLFGLDLYSVGLGGKIEGFFAQMVSEKGAVQAVLKKVLYS